MSDFALRPALTDADWEAVRVIRQRVFVEEQACPPEEEWDAADAPEARGRTTHHWLGTVGGIPAACARWRTTDEDGAPAAKLERFAVLPAFRGRGLGRRLVGRVLADARAAGHRRAVLHAQRHLAGFYRSFGFEAVGEPFREAGIEHVKMTWAEP